jgi:hypothetical protein
MGQIYNFLNGCSRNMPGVVERLALEQPLELIIWQ